jgi:hypothetical protein
MRTFCALCFCTALVGWCSGTSVAQEKTPDTKAIEAELDHFRESLFTAFNEGKYQEMLEKHCHKDVIATWQDGTTSKGYDGVLAEFDKLLKFISKMSAHPTTDKRLILNDGRLVIASGPMKDDYALKNHDMTVNLNSRWQATLIKENDRWVLVSFAASADAFDNQVVDLYLKKSKYTNGGWGIGIGLAVGIVLALVIGRLRRAA